MPVKHNVGRLACIIGVAGAVGWLIVGWRLLSRPRGLWFAGVSVFMAVLMLAVSAGIDHVSRGKDP